MNMALQGLVVGCAVAAAVLYAAWVLMPRVWRIRLQVRLGMKVKDAACGCDACPTKGALNAPLPPSLRGQRQHGHGR